MKFYCIHFVYIFAVNIYVLYVFMVVFFPLCEFSWFSVSSMTDPFTEIWLVIKVLSLLNVYTRCFGTEMVIEMFYFANVNMGSVFSIYGGKLSRSLSLYRCYWMRWVYLNFILITRIIRIENFVDAGYCVIFVCLFAPETQRHQ